MAQISCAVGIRFATDNDVRTTNIIIKQAKENSNGLLHIDR